MSLDLTEGNWGAALASVLTHLSLTVTATEARGFKSRNKPPTKPTRKFKGSKAAKRASRKGGNHRSKGDDK